METYGFNPKLSLAMAENMAIYKDEPVMWLDGADLQLAYVSANLT